MSRGAGSSPGPRLRAPGAGRLLPAAVAGLAVMLGGLSGFQVKPAAADHDTLVAASSDNFPPVNLLDRDGELTGFGRDLSTAVLRAVDRKAVHLHSGNWPEVLEWLDEGRADFIHDTGYTPDRTGFLDFSEPILEMPEGIFVLDRRYDIRSLPSLYGKRVACVNKHITHLYLQKIPQILCHIVATPRAGVQALLDGEADAFIYPRQIVQYYAYEMGAARRIKEVGEPLRTLTWHMTVKKGNNDVLLLLNQGIAKVRASGEYDRIYNKWFGQALQRGYDAAQVARIVGVVILVALFGFGAVAFWNWNLRRVVARRTGELRESEASLETAQRIARLGNWQCDVANGSMYLSREAYRILDTTPEEFGASCQGFKDLAVAEDRPALQDVLADCAGSGRPGQCEFRLADGEGPGKVLMLHAEREQESPLLIRGTIQDITERKRIEEEIASLNRDLEARVAARTEELEETHRRLILQERMAALGKLTGVVAHELRNPLGSIVSSAEVLRLKTADLLGNDLAPSFERIRRNVVRCDRIIAELLDYSRAQVIRARETGFDDWLAEALSDIEKPSDIELVIRLNAPGFAVDIDRGQMRRVLVNLVENACQALLSEEVRKTGGPRRVQVETRVDEGMLRLEVADNGPGIAAAVRDRIFEPLFSTRSFGAGLGLPIVLQIVEQHGGRMEVQSEPGHGAAFIVTLPPAGKAKIRSADLIGVAAEE